MELKIISHSMAKNVREFHQKHSEIGFTLLFLVLASALLLIGVEALAQVSLPGADESGKLEAAGTLLRIVDTGLFKWGTRVFAGLSIVSGGWALKEQRFGVAIMCIIAAILLGSAPNWVKNVFEIGRAHV